MVRLKDIAKEAGVSVMTVSKVMRDAPDISAATKARVRVLAEKMGYVPDSGAQALRYRSARLFGLLIPSPTNPVFARIVMAIEQRAHELGYDLLIGHTMNEKAREEYYIRRFMSRRIDGLFLTPVYRMEPEARVYAELARHRLPTVLFGHHAPFCKGFANVEVDDLAASAMATRHLIELGHRRIAFFTGPQVSPGAQERFEGYRRALKEAQIPEDERLIFQAGSTIEEGKTTALQYLNESPQATAVQAANDLVAIGAASIFLEQKIKIPEQLSVVGYGNILTSEYFLVPLTTIRQPKFRLGLAAMDTMLKLLQGQEPGVKRLPAEIIVRKSTAAPPPKQ
ncbi:MAG: LacI family DNA-binding transcriptional regulator [Pedosphaera parvula]|nr:LacI family DNA-binding transcriptional regulator [Pedosphaera parvula]